MLKELFGVIALSLIGAPLFAGADNQETWMPFDKEYVFAAEILTRSDNLEYWAMPMPEDEKGFSQANEMIHTMQSLRHRVNPLIIPVRLSGVRYDYNKGQSLAKDDFTRQVEADLTAMGSQKLAYVRCTGRYTSANVALCLVSFNDDMSLQQDLLSKGYVTLSDNPKETPADVYPLLKAAELKAQEDEVGIWVPFYFMMKGL